MIFDDLSKPVTEVARGQISNEYYFEQSRNVSWKMRNDYLRHYLWMRGHVGVRSFNYKSYIRDSEEIRALLQGKTYFEKYWTEDGVI